MAYFQGYKKSYMELRFTNITKQNICKSFCLFYEMQQKKREYFILQNRIEIKCIPKPVKIFKNYKPKNYIRGLSKLLSKEENIPQGYYCYPCNDAIFQKNSFDINYYPLLSQRDLMDGLNCYKDDNIKESFHSYPRLPTKIYKKIRKLVDKNFDENKEDEYVKIDEKTGEKKSFRVRCALYRANLNCYFIIWCFVNLVKDIIKQTELYFMNFWLKENSLFQILKELNVYLKIDLNELFNIVNKFLDDARKNILKKISNKRGTNFKNFNKYYCRICDKFCCSFHFKISKNEVILEDGIKSYFEKFESYKGEEDIRPPEYSYKEYNDEAKYKKYLDEDYCDYCNYCRNNVIKVIDDFTFKDDFSIFKNIKDEDFYLMCYIYFTTKKIIKLYLKHEKQFDINYYKLLIDPCIYRKYFPTKRYTCDIIKDILDIFRDDSKIDSIKKYLKSINYDDSIFENSFQFADTSKKIRLSKITNNEISKQKISMKTSKKVKATAKAQVKDSENNVYYKPCDHFPLSCDDKEANCNCKKLNFCLKYCSCYQHSNINGKCNYFYNGCHHQKTSNCLNCACFNKDKINILIECDPEFCNCGKKCMNRGVTFGNNKKLIFGYSKKIKGGGLFAGEKIKNNEFIAKYSGELVEKEELDRLSIFDDQTFNNYPFNLNEEFDYRAIKCGNIARYINHASHGEENVTAKKILVNGVSTIAFYACRDINIFEELFYDYGYSIESMPEWMLLYEKQFEGKDDDSDSSKKNKKKFKMREVISLDEDEY